jgi:peptidyl-prolyl cis-trans isomerase A (cyclophilin A)
MYGKFRLLAGVATAMLFSAQTSATIVQFQTNMGSFDVNLYDRLTPATVTNFLAYVNASRYTNAIMHRSVGGFVVQGGGFTYQGTTTFGTVTQNPAVVNEPRYSNVRGTIAMAKLSGSVNSATSQWFINMGNNSANLDVQNGGFTVFGQVTGNGMAIVDAMNALQAFNISASFDSIPLRNYTSGATITDQNLVIVSSVIVLDPSLDTASGIVPVSNTLINQPPVDPGPGGGGGGGATGVGSLLLLGMLNLWRRRGISRR